MIAARKCFLLALAATLAAGCSGGGTTARGPRAVIAAKPLKALAFVHIQWPSKKTSSHMREAKFISTSATRVEVNNVGYDPAGSSVPASDLKVQILAGTATALLPAFTNVNNVWTFNEYDGSGNILASAYVNYGSIIDPTVPIQIDVVLTTNAGNMGVRVSSPDANGSCSVGTPCKFTVTTNGYSGSPPALVSPNSINGFTFAAYLQATDLDGVLISGPGVPGVSLTDSNLPDANVRMVRLTSDLSGPFAGAPKYSITIPNGSAPCGAPDSLNLNAVSPNPYDSTSTTTFVGTLNIGNAC